MVFYKPRIAEILYENFGLVTVTPVSQRFIKDGEIQNNKGEYVCAFARMCAYVYLAQLLRGKNVINKKRKKKEPLNVILLCLSMQFVILDLMCRSPIIDTRRGGKSV